MAAKPIMVLSSDWHLNPISWKKHQKIQRDSYYSLQQIVDLSLDLNVPLIGAGDLFDVKLPPSESVLFCYEQMQRLNKANLPMYYVQGQHEYAEKPWLNLCSNAQHIDSFKYDNGIKIFDIQGLRVCGMDIEISPTKFSIRCESLKTLAKGNQLDLFVTHQVWADFIQKRDSVFSLQNATFAKMVYTGDYHKTEVLDVAGTICLSSGSINMQANNESPHKVIFILNDDLTYTAHQLKTRPFSSFEIRTEENLNGILNRHMDDFFFNWPYRDLPDYIQTPLIAIKYQNNLPNAFEALSEKFKDWNYDLSPVDFSSIEIKAAADRRQVQDLVDIGECVSQFVPEDSLAHKDAVRIFTASDVEAELMSMRKEHLESV